MTASSETPLHIPFVFSFMRRGGSAKGTTGENKKDQEETISVTTGDVKQPEGGVIPGSTPTTQQTGVVHPYENSIKTIAIAGTVEEFWQTYDFLKRPNFLPTTTDYHFFRNGIKPTWEDPSNAKGGKWIIRMPKGLASRYWEEIILALIGHQFSGIPDGEICGAVLSIRYSEDILGVWNRNASDREMVDRIRDAIKKVLQLPPLANMEYKPHQTSLQDRSSFRNTQLWKPKSLESRSGQGEARRTGTWSERDKPRRISESRGSWRQVNH